jgi:flagellar motor switch/type III secretory pathway protein FliN
MNTEEKNIYEENDNKKGDDINQKQFLSSIPVHMTLVVGEKYMSLQELMVLKCGDLVAFSSFIGDPVTIWVDGQKIAHGEFLLEEECISILITKIESEKDVQAAHEQKILLQEKNKIYE